MGHPNRYPNLPRRFGGAVTIGLLAALAACGGSVDVDPEAVGTVDGDAPTLAVEPTEEAAPTEAAPTEEPVPTETTPTEEPVPTEAVPTEEPAPTEPPPAGAGAIPEAIFAGDDPIWVFDAIEGDATTEALAETFARVGRGDVAHALAELAPFPVDVPQTDDAYLADFNVSVRDPGRPNDDPLFSAVSIFATYLTAATPTDIETLYRTVLPGGGWELDATTTATTDDGSDVIDLTFARGDRLARALVEDLRVTIIDSTDGDRAVRYQYNRTDYTGPPETALRAWVADLPVPDGYAPASFSATTSFFSRPLMTLTVGYLAVGPRSAPGDLVSYFAEFPAGPFTATDDGSLTDPDFPTFSLGHEAAFSASVYATAFTDYAEISVDLSAEIG